MMASENPRRSITIASSVYITPIRLWSTLVIHSSHRYGKWPLITTQARTARIATSTTPPATSGMGWSNGIAAQVSLPSIGGPDLCGQFRSRSRRDALGRDAQEKFGVVQTIERLVLGHGLLRQFLVAVEIERRIAMHGLAGPVGEFVLRNDMNVEQHVRETIAAEMR